MSIRLRIWPNGAFVASEVDPERSRWNVLEFDGRGRYHYVGSGVDSWREADLRFGAPQGRSPVQFKLTQPSSASDIETRWSRATSKGTTLRGTTRTGADDSVSWTQTTRRSNGVELTANGDGASVRRARADLKGNLVEQTREQRSNAAESSQATNVRTSADGARTETKQFTKRVADGEVTRTISRTFDASGRQVSTTTRDDKTFDDHSTTTVSKTEDSAAGTTTTDTRHENSQGSSVRVTEVVDSTTGESVETKESTSTSLDAQGLQVTTTKESVASSDGFSVSRVTETFSNGTSRSTELLTDSDGSAISTTSETDAQGNTVTQSVQVDAAGNTVITTSQTDAAGDRTETVSTYDPSGALTSSQSSSTSGAPSGSGGGGDQNGGGHEGGGNNDGGGGDDDAGGGDDDGGGNDSGGGDEGGGEGNSGMPSDDGGEEDGPRGFTPRVGLAFATIAFGVSGDGGEGGDGQGDDARMAGIRSALQGYVSSVDESGSGDACSEGSVASPEVDLRVGSHGATDDWGDLNDPRVLTGFATSLMVSASRALGARNQATAPQRALSLCAQLGSRALS